MVTGVGTVFGATDGTGVVATVAGGAGGTAWLGERLSIGAFATVVRGEGTAVGGRVACVAGTDGAGAAGTTGAAGATGAGDAGGAVMQVVQSMQAVQ